MDKNFKYISKICFCQITLPIIIFASFCVTYGQIGLKVQEPLPENQYSDTLGVVFPHPVLPLWNWRILNDQYLQVEKSSDGLNVYDYISPDYMPRNPFELDLRGTSNYVPREVRDELNLIMNRPRDAAFLPILPVAFLALQLASQYLLISKKIEITADNIQNSRSALSVLEVLWAESPQTMTQMYKHPIISNSHTMNQMQDLVYLLIDNKLVKSRKIDNAETKYFSAIDKLHYENILSRARAKKEELSQPESALFGSEQGEK